MKKYIEILEKTKLFDGVVAEEIDLMLNCLGATIKAYKKGEYVFRQGEIINNIAVLVEGKLHIQRDDYWGNRSIINLIEVGEMFGEAYAATNGDKISNDIIAIENSVVIFFDINKILGVCPCACRFHSLTVRNLFFAISEKNRKLMSKLGVISERTTKEKLIAYLSEEAKRQNETSFEIPFNRQQLADFLGVDRSAMSNELCKMRDAGMLEFNKNKFRLL